MCSSSARSSTVFCTDINNYRNTSATLKDSCNLCRGPCQEVDQFGWTWKGKEVKEVSALQGFQSTAAAAEFTATNPDQTSLRPAAGYNLSSISHKSKVSEWILVTSNICNYVSLYIYIYIYHISIYIYIYIYHIYIYHIYIYISYIYIYIYHIYNIAFNSFISCHIVLYCICINWLV